MAFSGTGQSVRNFVQDHLLHLIFATRIAEMAGETNRATGVVTLTKPSFGVVKTKTPGGQVVMA